MKKKIGLILALFATLSMAAFVGCKDTPSSSDSQSASSEDVSGEALVELAAYKADIATGETVQIQVLNWTGAISFTARNPEIATVTSNGVVSGVADGSTVIEVVCGADILEFTVNVSESLEGTANLKLNVVASQIYVGYSLTLEPTLTIGGTVVDKSKYTVSYQSSNGEVLSVSDEGIATGLTEGEASITAKVTIDGKEYSATATLSIIDISIVSLNKSSTTLSASGDFQHDALSFVYKKYENGAFTQTESPTPVWKSSDESVVTVDANGVLTGVSAGTATITLICGKASTVCDVTVYAYYAKIFDAVGFLSIGKHLDGHFELMNDIDFTGVAFDNPFGFVSTVEPGPTKLDNYEDDAHSVPFTGYLNGNGYSVRNLTHAGGNGNNRFERTIFTRLADDAVIENIGFYVTNNNTQAVFGAGVCGSNHGTIKNVFVDMTLAGVGTGYNQWGTAGVANLNYGSISECVVNVHAPANVKNGTTICLGGITNTNRGGKISACLAIVNSAEVAVYSHPGSWGTVSGSSVVTTASAIVDAFDKALLSSAIWNTTGDVIPTLKNTKETILRESAIYVGLNGSKGISLNVEGFGEIKAVSLNGKEIEYTLDNATLVIEASRLAGATEDSGTLIIETDSAIYLCQVKYSSLAVDQALKLEYDKSAQAVLTFMVADVEGTIEKVTIGDNSVAYSLDGAKLSLEYAALARYTGEQTLSVHTNVGSYNYSLLVVSKYLSAENVTSFVDLKALLEADMNGYYVLTSNIDLTAAGNNSQRVTRAIGYNGSEFNGVLDGRGFAIQNMEFNWRADGGNHYHSLFQTIGAKGTVKNLAVTGVTVKTNSARSAGLAINNNGTVENCFVEYNATAGVSGSNSQWGQAALVLKNNGTMTDCLAKLTISTDLGTNYICLVTDNNGTINNVNGIVSAVGEGDATTTNSGSGTKTHCGIVTSITAFYTNKCNENYTSSYWTFDAANTTVSFGGTVVLQ